MFSDVAKYWKQYKTTKLIKVKRIASIWCQNDKNNSKLHTRSNYYQFASIWRQNNQKHWGTVAKHSKQRKTTKLIKLQWIDSIGCQNDQNNSKLQTRSNYEQFASIWRQNDKKSSVTSQNIQNNAKLHNWSNYNELLLFDVRTIKTLRYGRKTFKTTQNYKTDQIIMHRIDLTSKRSKKLRYVPKLQNWSNYNGLHRFDIKTIQNVEIRRKTFKTTQTNESDQIILHCIDLTSKRSKLLSYVPKLQK